MIEFTKGSKKEAVYKTLYLSKELLESLEDIAVKNDVSFNRVIITILEDFISKKEE